MYGLDITKNGAGATDWTLPIGWEQVVHTGSGAYPAFYRQDTIDIGGITSQGNALVPSNIEVHQSPLYRAGGLADPSAEPSNCAVEWVMLTTVPFNVDAWASGNTIAFFPYRIPTAFGTSDPANLAVLSAGDCLYGRVRYIQNEADTPDRIAYSVREEFFGSLGQTMADELYVTRIISWVGIAPAIGAMLTVPDIEFNIDAYLGEMSELSQIMELRRSYLTQQTVA